MIETTQNVIDLLFTNKNVILIGNSVEILNHDLAEYIDSFDVVVRFGKAIEADIEKKSIGKKIDVWVTGEFRGHMLKQKKYKEMMENVPIIYNRARIDLSKEITKIPELQNSYDMFSDDELINIYNRYGIKSGDFNARRLSVGVLMIMFMVEKFKKHKSLTIVGFDFFVKSTPEKRGGTFDPCSWHRPILFADKEVHDHMQEVLIVNDYIEKGLLKWNILSNLNEESIRNVKYGKY